MMKTNIDAELKRMEQEYSRLSRFYSDFRRLKLAADELRDRAATDPAAAKKLNDLQALIPQGAEEVGRRAERDIQVLNAALKQLQSRLKHIVNNQTNSTAEVKI